MRTTRVRTVTKASAKIRKLRKGRMALIRTRVGFLHCRSRGNEAHPLQESDAFPTIFEPRYPARRDSCNANQFDSNGNTFTSTRRLRLLCSALLGSVEPGS